MPEYLESLENAFTKVLEMSAAGSIVILAVLMARLLLKKSPKIYSYLLWLVVLFRLLCPMIPEVSWGAVPEMEIASYPVGKESLTLESAAGAAYRAVEGILSGSSGGQYIQATGGVVDYLWWDVLKLVLVSLLEYLWLIGMLALLGYSFWSLWKLRRQLVGAVHLEDNVWLADHIETPFVMGLFRPKIYLPSALPAEKRSFILRHERYHVKRKDHLVKLLAFAVLCIHWFNPLVWLAFFLLNRDMEMSCDEGVLKHWGSEVWAEYSGLLLELSTGRNLFSGAPLAFGEGDVGSRIKNILKYREPKRWQAALLLILVAGFGFFLSVDKLTKPESLLGNRYAVEKILYQNGSFSFFYTEETAPFYTITSDYSLREMPQGDGESVIVPLTRTEYSKQELRGFFEQGFWSQEGENEVYQWLDQVETVYRAEGEHNFYLVMQTRKDEILLAVGHNINDQELIRWLFELESIMTTPGDRDYMEMSIESKLGGVRAEIFAISGMGADDADVEYLVAGFFADGTEELSDVGYAVIRRVGWSYQMINCFVLQGTGQNENQIWYMEPAVLNESGELRSEDTYDVVLCNNPNLSMMTQVIKRNGEVVRTVDYPIYGQPAILLLNWAESEGTEPSLLYGHYADGSGTSVSLHFFDEVGNRITAP